MQFPFFNNSKENKPDGIAGVVKKYGIGALMVLVGFALGMGLHMLTAHRAIDRVAEVLRLTDASDQELITAVQQRAETFGMCASEEVKRETLWQLLRELVNRGSFAEVEGVVDEVLPPQVEMNAEWARRMLQVAHALVKNDQWDKAQAYYDAAQESFCVLNLSEEYAGVVRERASLLSAGSGGSREERMNALQKLLTGMTAQGTPDLAAELRVFLAKLERSLGAHVHAQEVLNKVVCDTTLPMSSPTLLVCRGYAYFALHDDEAAVNCLRDGLKLLTGKDAAARVYRALALRDLASVALNLGRAQTALALLERVEAEAGPVISPSALFRAEITGKRGWALYLVHDYEDALAIFKRQLDMIPEAEEGLRVHPLEGMSWCYLALGMPAEAQQSAQECCNLREKYYTEDKTSLGRSYLLHAQAQDQMGHPAAAEEWYGKAAATLPSEHRLRVSALEGQASALSQAQRWTEAVGVLEQLLNMVPQEDRIAREEIQEQIQQCRNHLAAPQTRPTPSVASQGKSVTKPVVARAAKAARKPAAKKTPRKRRKR